MTRGGENTVPLFLHPFGSFVPNERIITWERSVIHSKKKDAFVIKSNGMQ